MPEDSPVRAVPAAAARSDATTDARVPPREACVLRDVLERWCRERPDAVFVKTEGGAEIGFAALRAMVCATAAGLARLGVRQGDTVAVWMPNGVDALRVWFAINWLGAIYVPINVAYRGRLLGHALGLSRARLMVAHHELVPRLGDVDRGALASLVSIGGDAAPIAGLECRDAAALVGDPGDVPALERPIEPWDPQSIIFTSGTTGPSKGVLSSYAHMHAMSGPHAFPMLGRDDRYMCNLPLFHVGGTVAVVAMLNRGASIALVPQFSTADFWAGVRATRTTFVLLLGAMASFVEAQPASEADRDHPLRHVVVIPLLPRSTAFGRRFGVDVWTFFNMSEISVPLVSGPNPSKPGLCGRPRPGVRVRIVDEHDAEVAAGAVGELVLRTDAPWTLTSGYFGDPQATAAAWRNGWFHTGDLFRVDADGDYFFVDRRKDAVRRRGENVSSFEVEREVLAHPAVKEAAIVPVPAQESEDEILCVVALHPGRDVDPEALLRFLAPRLAHFMLPRYIRRLDTLPKTPTQKIEKYLLRREGVTPDTWDREAAGVKIGRHAGPS